MLKAPDKPGAFCVLATHREEVGRSASQNIGSTIDGTAL
jgi:hypothetical protein